MNYILIRPFLYDKNWEFRDMCWVNEAANQNSLLFFPPPSLCPSHTKIYYMASSKERGEKGPKKELFFQVSQKYLDRDRQRSYLSISHSRRRISINYTHTTHTITQIGSDSFKKRNSTILEREPWWLHRKKNLFRNLFSLFLAWKYEGILNCIPEIFSGPD